MSSTRLAAALAAAAIALHAACAPAHVRLPDPPPKSAPFAERDGFYREHKSVAVRPAPQATSGGLLPPTPLTYVILEDGTRVDHPEDLLPLVEPTSPTAAAVARGEQASHISTAAGVGMTALVGGGLALMFASLVPALLADNGAPDDASLLASISLLGAGTLVALGSLLALPVLMSAGTEELRERETAFLTYDRSLRERLDLIGDGAPAAPLALE